MKHTIEQIKLWGIRDWLLCFAPKPISYIGNLYDWIFPRYRETLLDKVGLFFKPRQRWIKNHIEYNHWCDKVELIPKFLFGCVIHYVDEEKCFERINFDATPEHKKFAKELKKCYEYAKNGRDELEKKTDEAYPEFSNTGSYEEMYGEVHRLEAEIRKLDKRYMTWIVANKDFMWV
jgi:hemerythrin